MANADIALEARARRAYEVGRVWGGLHRAAIAAPLAAISLLCCGRPAATCTVAALLCAAIAVFEWHGRHVGRGARIGIWAGAPALLMPILVQGLGHACGASLCALYPAVCASGGIAGGLVLITWCHRRGIQPNGLAAAGAVAALTGSLGCLLAGIPGLVGLAAGLALGAAPALVWRRA
jgi:hypothetical protein